MDIFICLMFNPYLCMYPEIRINWVRVRPAKICLSLWGNYELKFNAP